MNMMNQPFAPETVPGVLDTVLRAGQLLQQHGAGSSLVERTMQRLAAALGCSRLDVLLTPTTLLLSGMVGGSYQTRACRLHETPVDLTRVTCIVRLCDRAEQRVHSPAEVEAELDRILGLGPAWSRWQVVLTIGLSCAAFCRLFGGDFIDMAFTFVASAVAMFGRQQMARRHFNPYVNAGLTACVATLLASLDTLSGWGGKPDTALASAVLLLIPGVAFINSIQDLLHHYTVMGLARWTVGTLITVAIALGMLLALAISGVAP